MGRTTTSQIGEHETVLVYPCTSDAEFERASVDARTYLRRGVSGMSPSDLREAAAAILEMAIYLERAPLRPPPLQRVQAGSIRRKVEIDREVGPFIERVRADVELTAGDRLLVHEAAIVWRDQGSVSSMVNEPAELTFADLDAVKARLQEVARAG